MSMSAEDEAQERWDERMESAHAAGLHDTPYEGCYVCFRREERFEAHAHGEHVEAPDDDCEWCD